MDDLVQRLRRYSLRSGYAWYCHRAADRIEALERENGQCRDKWMQVCLKVSQLERENEVNERNVRQLIDDLAAARRENAELKTDLKYRSWV